MNILKSTLILGGFLLAAVPVYAQTYLYVDTSGNLREVVANNPTEAIQTAPNIALHSGVMTSNGQPSTVSVTTNNTLGDRNYGYIDNSGVLQIQLANSPEEALMLAPNRAPNSGVVLLLNTN